MAKLGRVVFWFGSEFEVRYLTDVPERGHFITRGGVLWVVEAVTTSEDGVSVSCVRSGE
jgi:hypothetical protein